MPETGSAEGVHAPLTACIASAERYKDGAVGALRPVFHRRPAPPFLYGPCRLSSDATHALAKGADASGVLSSDDDVTKRPQEPLLVSVLLPSRGRPDSLLRMLDSLYETAAVPDRVEAVVRIDDDDAPTLALDLSRWPLRRVVGPRLPMALLNTACLDAATGDILIAANDDLVVRSPGWDERLREAATRFADGVWLAWPNDLIQGPKLATFPAFSRTTAALLGDPFPAAFRGEFIDVHLKDIFERLKGRGHDRMVFVADAVFEHLHHRAGKTENDATYRERENRVDDHVYLELGPQRALTVARLLARIRGTVPPPLDGRLATGSFAWLTLLALLTGGSPPLWRLRVFSWLWRRRLKRYTHHADATGTPGSAGAVAVAARKPAGPTVPP